LAGRALLVQQEHPELRASVWRTGGRFPSGWNAKSSREIGTASIAGSHLRWRRLHAGRSPHGSTSSTTLAWSPSRTSPSAASPAMPAKGQSSWPSGWGQATVGSAASRKLQLLRWLGLYFRLGLRMRALTLDLRMAEHYLDWSIFGHARAWIGPAARSLATRNSVQKRVSWGCGGRPGRMPFSPRVALASVDLLPTIQGSSGPT
jgi:hypothetical protein